MMQADENVTGVGGIFAKMFFRERLSMRYQLFVLSTTGKAEWNFLQIRRWLFDFNFFQLSMSEGIGILQFAIRKLRRIYANAIFF